MVCAVPDHPLRVGPSRDGLRLQRLQRPGLCHLTGADACDVVLNADQIDNGKLPVPEIREGKVTAVGMAGERDRFRIAERRGHEIAPGIRSAAAKQLPSVGDGIHADPCLLRRLDPDASHVRRLKRQERSVLIEEAEGKAADVRQHRGAETAVSGG